MIEQLKIVVYLFIFQRKYLLSALSLFKKVEFYIYQRIWLERRFIFEEKTNFFTFAFILRTALSQFAFAFLLAFLVYFMDRQFLSKFLLGLGFLNYLIGDNGSINYYPFLAAISAMGAIFIGLYYAGIMAIGTTIYSKVPHNITSLLSRETTGYVYMRFLAFLTFFCLILFIFPPLRTAVFIVIILSGIGIIGFVKIGQNAYYLFDPTKLSRSVFFTLNSLIKQVTAGGFKWEDRSFQNYAHIQARKNLLTLETISEISSSKELKNLNDEPLVLFSQEILVFLINYQESKKRIPTNSLWFLQVFEHRELYKASDFDVELVYRSGGFVEPRTTSNIDWVEESIFPIVCKTVEINLVNENYTLVAGLLVYFEKYIIKLTELGRIALAVSHIKRLLNVLRNTPSYIARGDDSKLVDKIEISTRLCSGLTQILLTYIRVLQDSNRDRISERLSKIDWKTKENIYQQDFSPYHIPRLEWLFQRLQYEYLIEGKTVTPLWYQTVTMLLGETENFSSNSRLVIEEFFQVYSTIKADFHAKGNYWVYSAILSVEWDFWTKVSYHHSKLKNYWMTMKNEETLKEYKLPSLDVDTWENQIESRKTKILCDMARSIRLLALEKRPDNFPDFTGHFVYRVGEGIFEAYLRRDVDFIKDTFTFFFDGCLSKQQDLLPKIIRIEPILLENEILISLTPVIDLIELSGYAKLLSEFHAAPDIWDAVKDVWENYFGNSGSERTALIASFIGLFDSTRGIPPHSLVRQGWNEKIRRFFLESLKIRNVQSDNGFPAMLILHGSPLVRTFTRHDPPYGHCDGIDIFVSLYLIKEKGLGPIEFSDKRTNLIESIESEIEFYEKYCKEGT